MGRMLRRARKERGLTLEALGDQVGLTPGALSHIESGRRLPDPRNAVRIAEALSLPSEDVLRALDEEHATRRRSSAFEPSPAANRRQTASPKRAASAVPAFSAQPIEVLFDRPMQSASTSSSEPSVARNLARWSDDTSERIEAIDALADTAAEAIRTLRGLLEDEDPVVRREARRLLLELDVRVAEE